MTNPIPIQEGGTPDDGDQRLKALFDKLEGEQIEFLDQAGKRVVELSTLMIGSRRRR